MNASSWADVKKMFQPCSYEAACLGAPNPELRAKFPGKATQKNSSEYRLISFSAGTRGGVNSVIELHKVMDFVHYVY